MPFKPSELLVCKTIQRNLGSKKLKKFRVKLIQLKQGEILHTPVADIFHQHIIDKSQLEYTNDVSFNFLSDTISFSRPTLYEYISLKEQTAVSSHYSIISLVPMLLEIGRSSRVLECGTGSGSMTLFLSERLGSTGLLHTFDIASHKSLAAKKYFCKWKESYDLSRVEEKWPSNVKFGVKNLCEKGFDKSYDEFYDAIYLDLGEIDKAVLTAYKVLKLNGVIVMNALHLTQAIRVLNVIRENQLGLEQEIIVEPANRVWEMRKVTTGNKEVAFELDGRDGRLDWTCRLEDRYDEKFKRGGLFFNYWSGFLIKLRKIK